MLKIIRKFLERKRLPVQNRARITIPGERASDIFAIGDIHGHLDLLLAAEERIFARMQGANKLSIVVCVGDFVDRGPDSRGVIEHLINKMPAPFYRFCVCGNHDDAFLTFLQQARFDPAWLEFGGEQTLFSYGVDAKHLLARDPKGTELKQAVREHVPSAHVDFLTALPVALTIGKYLFVHAGILPGRPLAEQSDIDLMWIREPFLSHGSGLDLTVIHGHTPSINIQYGPNRVGIDTGAYATGKLSVVHIGAHGIAEI